MLFALPEGNGRLWYGDSNLHCERGSMRWHVYDPADLAAVARGEREQWGVQPARSWRPEYPGIPAELPGWDGEAPNMVSGVVFDPVDARLYVAVRFSWTGEYDAGTTVYAFDVARA